MLSSTSKNIFHSLRPPSPVLDEGTSEVSQSELSRTAVYSSVLLAGKNDCSEYLETTVWGYVFVKILFRQLMNWRDVEATSPSGVCISHAIGLLTHNTARENNNPYSSTKQIYFLKV